MCFIMPVYVCVCVCVCVCIFMKLDVIIIWLPAKSS
jgi:hypothetical protein